MSKAKKIVFQGERGANSHIACLAAYSDYEPVACATFEDALTAVSSGEADLGMIPIENSIAGRVADIHHLLPEFSALENVMIPQMIRGLPKSQAAERARQLLDYLRVGPRAEHRPAELSGGEQQRVAIARAVANAPLVLLADEPTGNLDPETSGYVFDALSALARQSGLAALVATHNHALAERMDRVVTLADGHIVPYSA